MHNSSRKPAQVLKANTANKNAQNGSSEVSKTVSKNFKPYLLLYLNRPSMTP